MVGAGEGEGPDEAEEWIIGCRPEDTAIEDAKPLGGEHVVDPQIAGWLGEVGGVEGGVALMFEVHATLEERLFGTACARRCVRGVDPGILQQLLGRPSDAVTIEWVGIHVAGDHEELPAPSPPLAPLSSYTYPLRAGVT